MASQLQKRHWTRLGAVIIATLIAGPVMAQGQDRPSRACMAEVRELCSSVGRRDRAAMRECVRENIDVLPEDCAAELRERAGARRDENTRTTQAPIRRIPVTRTVIYGADQRQQVDVYEPEDAVEELPLVLFVHGGGWSMGSHKSVQGKPAHFLSRNYYFGSAGYRVLPDAPVEEQAADLGAAIQALRGQASAIGFDSDRIVLIGHSAGAHLAALIATDPSFAGEAFGAIRGVVLLDGAGYDVPANIASANPRAFQLYSNVFGRDPARQATLSPIAHVGGPDAPHWLALYVEGREATRDQSRSLVSALIASGSEASALPIADTDHGRMNREIGTAPGAAQTEAIDAFLEQVFG